MVDIVSLKYFAALVETGSTVAASQLLHVTQPTLSRRVVALEKDLGVQLYYRQAGELRLTPAGQLLYERACEVLRLAQSIEDDVPQQIDAVKGDVYLGAGETVALGFAAKVMARMRETYPQVRFHVLSGTPTDYKEAMDRGRLDFLLEPHARKRVDREMIPAPVDDRWCVAMRADDELAQREFVEPRDLCGKPIMFSANAPVAGIIADWMGECFDPARVSATFSLAFDGLAMAANGLGYAFTFDGLMTCEGAVTRPLSPEMASSSALVWNKDHYLSLACRAFADLFREMAAEQRGEG